MSIKKLISVSGAALACSFCLAVCGGFTSSAAETSTTMAATTYVHVRNAAGLNGTVLGVLSPAEAVTVTGITNGWYNVEYKGHHAYVYQEYLNFEGSSADGDVENGRETDMKATAGVNIRSGAGTDYRIIGGLSTGQVVQVIGKTNGWYKVKHNGNVGYICGDFLTFLDSDKGFEEKKMTVTCAGLNFRQGPSKDSAIIGSFKHGNVLTVVGAEGSWYKVNHNGTIGYVYDEYVVDGVHDYSKENQSMTTTANVNMRTSGNMNARVIKVIPAGSSVKILSQEGGWYTVEYQGDAGAVYKDYLK